MQQQSGTQGYTYGYQQPPQPPKKKSRWWVWMLGLVVGALMMCGFVGAMMRKGMSEVQTIRQDKNVQTASQIPWLASVRANCDRYKAAPNEIKKSEIFNENEALLKDANVTSVRGVLRRLATNQGGSELRITVQVGDVTFATESVFAPISRGTPVYDAASNMAEGQCVTISTDKIRSSSLVEQSKVCEFDYFASFTELKPCG